MLSAGLSGRSLAQQERLLLLATVSLLSLLLWGLLLSDHQLLHDMARSGPAMQLLSGFLMWLIMMIAMMLPPVLPWIWFFAVATKETTDGGVSWLRTAIFSSGYFSLWGLFSLFAACLQVALRNWGTDGHTGLVLIPKFAGVLLITAGLFQFSALKNTCLKHCRSPLGYFLSCWEDGPAGAFRLGFGHGVYCLGCCWALMLLSFALGTMNVLWMGLVVLLLCGEKIAPQGERISRLAGVGLTGWGSYLVWLHWGL